MRLLRYKKIFSYKSELFTQIVKYKPKLHLPCINSKFPFLQINWRNLSDIQKNAVSSSRKQKLVVVPHPPPPLILQFHPLRLDDCPQNAVSILPCFVGFYSHLSSLPHRRRDPSALHEGEIEPRDAEMGVSSPRSQCVGEVGV